MASRHLDWFRQAEADLRLARAARDGGHFEWSCFAAQQAAEKALKALFQRHGQEAWGHTLSALIGRLPAGVEASADLVEGCKSLDKHYLPTRYPSGFDEGAPTDFYTEAEADAAIEHAAEIIEFCRSHLD